ncbi:DUF397 domain-containing protein [Streptomyces avicenniae]|uniref:DUF397 domain-containing protein n=1 Tax=Streptomyces avicenniae TaxID=500153 RepID=UPI00069BDAC0|nr:DUF397 domain-containing protein [Streptomyces avicenniae]
MAGQDIYAVDLGGAEFAPACGGNGPDGPETCVTLAPIPGVEGAYALGDSKRPEAAPLRFTVEELAAAGIDLENFGR